MLKARGHFFMPAVAILAIIVTVAGIGQKVYFSAGCQVKLLDT